MARKCKCAYCKKPLTTDIAYKIIINGKNKYYCSEEEYNQVKKEKDEKDSCLNVIATIMKIPYVTPSMVKEINKLRQFYRFNIIEKTFIDNEKAIKWFLNNNENSSEYGKVRYIITIIQNNINAINKKYKKEMEEKLRLFSKANKDKVDTDIINLDIQANTNNEHDISDFLD